MEEMTMTNLLESGLAITMIAKHTELSVDDVERLQK